MDELNLKSGLEPQPVEPKRTHVRWENPLGDINLSNSSAGIISGILGITTPTLLILQAARVAHFHYAQTISWLFAVYVLGGLFSIVLPWLYRIPITGAHSLSATAFLATAVLHFTYPQLIGGYMLGGFLLFLIGVSGLYARLIAWIPMEVISAMLAGMIASYVVKSVTAMADFPLLGSTVFLGYLVFLKWVRQLPAVLGSILAGLIALAFLHEIHPVQVAVVQMVQFHRPEWTWNVFFSLALPLSILVLSNDITPGIAALENFGYRPPMRTLLVSSGLASMLAGALGGQSANVAGMMSAICAGEDAGPWKARYVASMVSGTLLLSFGVLSWLIVPFIEQLPIYFITMLAGFSLLSSLVGSLRSAFVAGAYRLSSGTAFAIALSGTTILHLSATVWSLLIGLLMARFVEPKGS